MALNAPAPRLTRRRFLRGIAGLGLAAAGAGSYARWIEPGALEVDRVTIPGRTAGGAPVRIAHLSDLHASAVVPFDFIAKAVSIALAEKPDLIALTGDFFTNVLPEPARYAAILRRLADAAPAFACLGNHDGGPWTARAGGVITIDPVRGLLRDAGITCLHNTAQPLTVRGRALHLAGVGDLWSGMCRPAEALAVPAAAGALRVVLNHNPDAKELLRPFEWDVMLCGHTHGGQLRLPVLGTPFAPVRDKRFVEGLHAWQNRWIYVTRGVGNLHGLRFNCRPQVSVVTLG